MCNIILYIICINVLYIYIFPSPLLHASVFFPISINFIRIIYSHRCLFLFLILLQFSFVYFFILIILIILIAHVHIDTYLTF